MLVGAITIGGQMAPHFKLSQIVDGPIISGSHSDYGHNSRYEYVTEFETKELYLPHRDKRLQISLSSVEPSLLSALEVLDSSYDGMVYLQKLANVFADFKTTGQIITSGQHGSITLVATGEPLHLVSIYDASTRSAHLLWSTTDLSSAIRNSAPSKYLLYRYPLIQNRALFIPSMPIVSSWYSWTKKPPSPLLAFNALELKLFKEYGKL